MEFDGGGQELKEMDQNSDDFVLEYDNDSAWGYQQELESDPAYFAWLAQVANEKSLTN